MMNHRLNLTARFPAYACAMLLGVVACTTTQQTPAPEPPPAEPTVSLWEAASTGDIDDLDAHRRAGANLDSLHPQLGITPLVIAVGAGQHGAAGWLLENGADVNARNADGGTALIGAGFMGQAEAGKLLLDAGADPTLRNDNGETVWDIAALNWDTTAYIAGILELEVEREAVEAGRAELLRALQPHLAELAAGDVWLATAIGSEDTVRAEIANGLDVNKRNAESGATLLTVAALFGHADIVQLLIDAGADVNGRNYTNGSTALMAAALFGRTEVAKLLLHHDADPHVISDDGGTAATVAGLDWNTTAQFGNMLNVPLDEATMRAGKAATAELLRSLE